MTVSVENRPSPATPTPAPPAGPPELTVSLTCTAKAALTPTPCNVTARFDGATLPSAKVTNVDWDWGDGVPVPPQTTVPATTHTYSVAGSYTIFATVTATTPKGVKTVRTSTTIIVP